MDATKDNPEKGLLPSGMQDVLPPNAMVEAEVIESLLTQFGTRGYERVKPPLLEFEENLLRGPGSAMASQTFRLMDPISQRMMGLRADMTPQVARIAMTRLKNVNRPLRLSYSGEVLRVKGSQLRGERQFAQVGVEIIGANTHTADSEIILMAATALTDLGVNGLSVDLCIPTLVPAICRDQDLDDEAEMAICSALNRKDSKELEQLAAVIDSESIQIFHSLLAATGPADNTLSSLKTLRLGKEAKLQCDTLSAVTSAIGADAPELELTIDPVENRGWKYHTGITYTFFAKDVRGELGTGGRYVTDYGIKSDGGEHATGLTLFMDTLLRALPAANASKRIFMPFGTSHKAGHSFREKGWITIYGLDATEDSTKHASDLDCDFILEDGKAIHID